MLTHAKPFKMKFRLLPPWWGKSHTVKKGHSGSVLLSSVKWRSLMKEEESLLRLCCLLQLHIQSFVLYCCFNPSGAPSRPSSSSSSSSTGSPAGSSVLIGQGSVGGGGVRRAHRGGFRRFSFVYTLVQKTPITSVTLSNQTIHRQTHGAAG